MSTLELMLRMVVSLLVLGGLFWLINRAAKGRLGNIGRSPNAPLEIHARKQLSKSSSVALIRAGERHLLIGVTDTGISLLAEGDDLVGSVEGAEETDAQPATTSLASTSLTSTSLTSTESRSAVFGRTLLEGIKAKSPLRAAGNKIDAEHGTTTTPSSNDISNEMAAIGGHWEKPETTKQATPKRKSTTKSSAAAGKPQRGAASSTKSGTSALDALRDKTVRKT